MAVGCAAYDLDCSDAASFVRQGGEIADVTVGQADSNVYITGVVTYNDGGEWAGIFEVRGYEICGAKLSDLSITSPSTFNTRIVRDNQNNGLGFYAVIPKNRPSRQWVDAYMLVHYVRAGTLNRNRCMDTDYNPWLCEGQNCHDH
jgi:hypothetical protein